MLQNVLLVELGIDQLALADSLLFGVFRGKVHACVSPVALRTRHEDAFALDIR